MKERTVQEILGLIAKRRRSEGIDVAMLASFANVSPKFISQLENGKETVEVDSLVKVAHALGMKIPILFDSVQTGAIVKAKRIELVLDQITGATL
jgi:transcriptional regulator with XRE-family HTH domain